MVFVGYSHNSCSETPAGDMSAKLAIIGDPLHLYIAQWCECMGQYACVCGERVWGWGR